MHKHAVIVGGGISGLSLAFFLSQKIAQEDLPLKITLLEAEDRLGGVLRTIRTRDFHMEAGADAFDGRDPSILDFCKDLGLSIELERGEPALNRVFLSKNKNFFPLDISDPKPADILKNPALSWASRARLVFEGLVPARKKGSDETIADFVRRRFGGGFFREWAEPLVRGILMGDAERLSVHEYFPQWEKAEKEHGGFLRKRLKQKNPEKGESSFFTLRGGLDHLAGALLKRLRLVDFEASSQAVSLGKDEHWKVFLRDGRTIDAELVFVALPAPEASRLLMSTAAGLAGELARIRYDSLIALNMIFRREEWPANFPESGFIVPSRGEKWPFASLKIIGGTEDGAFMRLRAFVSGAFQPEAFGWEDEKIKREVLNFLKENRIIQPPFWMTIERYPEALVQYEVGHAAVVSGIDRFLEQYPGLFLAGNGYQGFGISDCIRSAKTAVERIKLF